jgi:hypothetical protein
MHIEIEYLNLDTHFASLIEKEFDYSGSDAFEILNETEVSDKRDSNSDPYFNSYEGLLDKKGNDIYFSISRTISGLTKGIGLINDIFKLVFEINKTILLSESVFSIERSQQKEYTIPIRDHLFHPTVVYLLGKGFLNSDTLSGKFQDELSEMLKNSKLGRDAIRFAGYKVDPVDKVWRDVISRAWCIAALSHDLAYCIEPTMVIEKRFYANDFFKDSNELSINSKLNIFQEENFKEVFNDIWDIVYQYFIEPIERTRKANQRLNHGQLQTVFIIRKYYNDRNLSKVTEVDKLTLFLSLVMIFRHDEWSKYKNLEEHKKMEDPLTTFFCLNDLLAEMRYVFNPIKSNPYSALSKTTWKIDFWLPYIKIALSRNLSTNWEIKFSLNPHVDKKTRDEGRFDRDLSIGKGDNEIAKNKLEQYKIMFQLLNLAENKATISVN